MARRMGSIGLRAAGFGVGVGVWALTGGAMALPPQDPSSIVTLQVENDAVSTLKGTSDQYYTSGLRLGYVSPTTATPEFLQRAGRAVWGDGVQRISFDISQSIFTPRDTQANPAPRRDHPYAGWLHADAALMHDSDRARSVVGVSLGVIGPSALGRQVQNGFHDLIGDPDTKGWGNQLKDEVAFNFLVERTWRLPVARFSNLEVDTLPAATIGFGSVRDYVQLGASIRLGQGLDSDYGAPRIRPGLSGTDAYTPTRPFAWYVFAGADGQIVGRDEFIDGSAFRTNGPGVSKKPFIGEFQAGAAFMLKGVRVTYTQVWQSTSFSGQKGGLFSFGSLAASVRF